MTAVRQSGFTLLELVLVLLVIGLASGLAMANWQSGEALRHERNLQRLAQSFQLAAQLARHGQQIIGWQYREGQHGFVALQIEDQQALWRPFEHPQLHTWPWPQELHLQGAPGVADAPQVVWLASGAAEAVSLHWRWPGGERLLWIDADGRSRLQGPSS